MIAIENTGRIRYRRKESNVDTIDLEENDFIPMTKQRGNVCAVITQISADDLQDAQDYACLVDSLPEGNIPLNEQEKHEFEHWLGL